MNESSDQPLSKSVPEKDRRIWEKPELRRLNLTDEEITKLCESDDPATMLRELWPRIKERDPD